MCMSSEHINGWMHERQVFILCWNVYMRAGAERSRAETEVACIEVEGRADDANLHETELCSHFNA